MSRYPKPEKAGLPPLKDLATKDGGLVKLAKALGITQQSISNYVTGKHYPEIPILMAIADYYSVSVDYLLGRKETKVTPDAIQRAEARGYAAGLRLAADAMEDLSARIHTRADGVTPRKN